MFILFGVNKLNVEFRRPATPPLYAIQALPKTFHAVALWRPSGEFGAYWRLANCGAMAH